MTDSYETLTNLMNELNEVLYKLTKNGIRLYSGVEYGDDLNIAFIADYKKKEIWMD